MADKNNNHANAELLDAVLKSAFTDAFQQEMADLEADAEQYKDRRPTEEQMKAERRAYKKSLRKPTRVWSVARRIAASFLIVLGLGGITMFCVPEVNAVIIGTIVEFLDNHVDFNFSKNSSEVQLGAYTLNYLPKGYVLTDSTEAYTICRYTFTNNNERIVLHCLKNSLSQISSDDENRTMMPIEITNYVAYALIPKTLDNEETEITIVWGNEESCFMLKGNLSLKEMTKIARGFQTNQ